MFMNGSNTVAEMRQGGALPQIFVLSHDLSEESVTALLEEGVNQFIALPVAPERLRSKVSTQQKEYV
jgi:DNA-binding response OmpR family regulator